jgi:hypothetical protein
MKRRIAAILLAIGTALGLGVAVPEVAHAYPQACTDVYANDGVKVARTCITAAWGGGGGSTWLTTERRTFNVPPSQGGHTDVIDHTGYTVVGGYELCDNVADGGSCVYTQDYTVSTANTVWQQVSFPFAPYCKQFSMNYLGATSLTNC